MKKQHCVNSQIVSNRNVQFKVMKLITLGYPGCRKSSLIRRYLDDVFREKYIDTKGVDFRIKTVKEGGKCFKVNIWDTAGQNQNMLESSRIYFQHCHGLILVFDLTNPDSLQLIIDNLSNIQKAFHSHPIILIGNKSDLLHSPIDQQKIKEVTKQLKAEYYQTSCLDSTNVETALDSLVDQAIQFFFKESDPVSSEKKNQMSLDLDQIILQQEKNRQINVHMRQKKQMACCHNCLLF